MKAAEWDKEARRLQAAITRADTQGRKAPSLAERVDALKLKREHQEALRVHRLSYHDLVD